MWARIENNKVVEVTDVDPEGRFHPSIAFIECGQSTQLGDVYQNGSFSSPPYDAGAGLDAKQLEIVDKFKSAMSPITGIYTDEDIASFPTQEAEAKAWQTDNTAATPFIDGLLANRPSIDKPTLVQRIIDNANTYKLVAGPAIGKKQHFEDLLYALKGQHEDPEQPDVTKADIDAIVVDYS